MAPHTAETVFVLESFQKQSYWLGIRISSAVSRRRITHSSVTAYIELRSYNRG